VLRARQRLLSILPDDRIHSWVVAIDPLKRHVHELARRDFLLAQGVGGFCHGCERRFEIR